jgi:hypothetical protein
MIYSFQYTMTYFATTQGHHMDTSKLEVVHSVGQEIMLLYFFTISPLPLCCNRLSTLQDVYKLLLCVQIYFTAVVRNQYWQWAILLTNQFKVQNDSKRTFQMLLCGEFCENVYT